MQEMRGTLHVRRQKRQRDTFRVREEEQQRSVELKLG